MPYRSEIWDINLLSLGKSPEELQLIDRDKPNRPHLVLQTCRLRGVSVVTVVPLQSNDPTTTQYKVQVDASKLNGLFNDSWVVCCQIMTVENKFLSGKFGILEKDLFEDVLVVIKSYLRVP